MAARNHPPNHLPPDVRDHPAVIAACRERDIGRLLRIINNLTTKPTQFTPSHIARRCELTPTRVSEYMNGRHNAMSVDVIARVANGLGIPAERFGLASDGQRTPTGSAGPLSTNDTQQTAGRSARAHQKPTPNLAIRARRIARRWSQEQAADTIAQAVADNTRKRRPISIDAQYIARLERGEIRWPNIDFRAALRTVYGAATDTELGLFEIRHHDADSIRIPTTALQLHEFSPATLPGTAGTSGDPGNSLEQALIAAAEEAADFGAWAEQMNRGTIVIERLHQRTRQLASACLSLPPAVVMAHARPLSRDVFAMARQHHKPAQARDLYMIATYLCSMMAWLAGDLGALEAAELQARTAWACAEIADDAESTAWALSVQAKIAFQRRDYTKTVELTRRGLRYDSTGTSRVMLVCQEADALSLLGATDKATESIRRADTEADRIHGADSIGGLLSCGPARHANYAAGVYLLAGRTDLALSEANRALDQLNSSGIYGFGTVAQLHLTRTAAHVRAGQIDGAAEAARPVLDLPPERRLATLTERLKPLTRVLDRPALRGSTLAGSLRTEIAEYCTAASPTPRELTSSSTESDS